MNCIDAIEGTVKSILNHLYRMLQEGNIDDTEYMRDVKAVIDGTDLFILENQEIACKPDTLEKVLYGYARDLWLRHRAEQSSDQGPDVPPDKEETTHEYQGYCYDHFYHHGVYPR